MATIWYCARSRPSCRTSGDRRSWKDWPIGSGSTRTLNRRFKAATGETPLEFLQKARIERARGLLETSRLSFDQIVERVGYEDGSSFRRLFKRAVGISPHEYRRRFSLHKP